MDIKSVIIPKTVLFILLNLIFSLLTTVTYANEPTRWQTLAEGLEYATVYPNPYSLAEELHAFRIDLKYYQLNMVLARDMQLSSSYVSDLAKSTNALIAINGGFFSPDMKPLGLRIQDGSILNPIKGTSWWGVFVIRNEQARILAKSAYQHSKKIDFAVQAGPRLIIDGKIPKLKENQEQRSALGITQEGKVILAATENAALSTYELAEIMRRSEEEGGLACRDALNLDGGTSSQLYAKVGGFSLYVPSLRMVTDAIIVTIRNN